MIQLPETPYDVVTRKVGKQAARVWQFLQSEEVRPNGGPQGEALKEIAAIVHGTGFDRKSVEDYVLALALNGLVRKITADGRVSA